MAFATSWAPQQKGIVLDGFAGPGGWSEGIRRFLGLKDVGLEWDRAASETRAAAGHTTIRVDVSAFVLTPLLGKVWGLLMSPPCTLFSDAGNQVGRLVLDVLAEGVRRLMAGEDCRDEMRERVYPVALAGQQARNAKRPEGKRWTNDRMEAAAREEAFIACLILEPARYLHALITAPGPQTPFEWAAFEQVPAALPVWQVYAQELRALGWSVWAGVLNSVDYGVGQSRRRAVLIASAVRQVAPPEPTHSGLGGGEDLFGGCLAPWRTMADVLGRGVTDRPAPTVTSGGAKTGGAEPFPTNARKILTDAQKRGAWTGSDSIRINVTEAGLLQSFPADYPWQGGKNKGHEQAGNAVPPLLAAHVVSAATGIPVRQEQPSSAAA
ncbi:DNA cytosine methyltransferase [Streptomyces sp. NPDC056227]|uniref:DNA cytosine methyltransferase n=1 Tax=Streptomyces sp. NPDC056227 TaxID=3345753 RepID=UPI0035D988CA